MTKHKKKFLIHILLLIDLLNCTLYILYALWYIPYLYKIYVHVNSPGSSHLIDLLTPILCHIIVMERFIDCPFLQEFDHLASNPT